MRCNHHSRQCIECDECLVSCNECSKNEGGECDEVESRYYGDCVDGLAVCCLFFEQRGGTK